MKKTLLSLFLAFTGMASAQVITIPDANFKAKMVTSSPENPAALNAASQGIVVDINGDGEIQQSEALLVYKIHVGGAEISSLEGIAYFTNLAELVAGYDNLTTVDLTALTNLKMVNIAYNPLTSINVAGLLGLERLYLFHNQLTTLDLTGLTSLEELHCGENYFTSLSLSGLPSLTEIKINEQYTDNPPMFQELLLSDLPALIRIDIENTHLSTLDLSGVPSLRWLIAPDNPFTSLDLTVLPELRRVDLTNTLLTHLDLSQSPFLQQCNVHHNPQLTYLNLKNGSICNNYIIPENPSLTFVCIDEGEEAGAIAEWLELYNITNLQINTYCSVSPGGDYNTITGSLTFSDTGDCAAAQAFSGTFAGLTLAGSGQDAYMYTNTGTYNFYTGAGSYTIMPQISSDWFTVTPSPATVTFANDNNNVSTQNFCITANGLHPDAEVTIIPVTPARPGFDAEYKIVYTNKGNQTLNGDVIFTYNDAVLDYVSATPVQTSATTGQLTWGYTSLLPFESRDIWLTLTVNSPMDTPAVTIDDVLNLTAEVTPAAGDETPVDNVFGLKQVVVGSFDPNDITCLEGEIVHPDMIGEYLHYNINFENTGTAPATFIVVKDVIDETQFDLNSLQLINASYGVEVRKTDNKIEFYFDDINLAGNGGKGNVTFKIKSLGTLALNDAVSQKAEIFFDYNWPIETNEATTIFAILGAGAFDKDATVKVYPNPVGGILNITSANELQHIELYDLQGRLLQAGNVTGTETKIDVSNRAAGTYFVKIITDKGVGIEMVIKE